MPSAAHTRTRTFIYFSNESEDEETVRSIRKTSRREVSALRI
jgi:hypothetical protein